jgi:hypothetical protein
MAVNLVDLESLVIDLPTRPQANKTYETPQYSLACYLLSQSRSLTQLQISSYNFDSANNRFTESPLRRINQNSFGSLTTLRVALEVLVDGPLVDPYQGLLLDGALVALVSLEVFELSLVMVIFAEHVTFEEGVPSLAPGIFQGGWRTLDMALAPAFAGGYEGSIPALQVVDICIQLTCFERGVVNDEDVLDQVAGEILGLRLVEGEEVYTNFEGLEYLTSRRVLRKFDLRVEEFSV